MVLAYYASLLPVCVAMIVGVLLALVRWKIHPRISLFTVIGLGVRLLGRLAWIVVYALLLRYRFGMRFVTAVMTGTRVIDGLVAAGCWALILAAIFCDGQTAFAPRRGAGGAACAGRTTRGPDGGVILTRGRIQ